MDGHGADRSDSWTAPGDAEAQFEVLRYDPARFLQGLVASAWRQAEERGQAVHVQGPWPTIAVYPSSFTAVVAGGEGSLRAYAGKEDLPRHASLVFARAPQFDVNHPDMVPLDVLLWKLALGASRGRLPRGTTLDTPCALREWPNFTRLIVTPGAMSVAALWARQTCTLSQTIHLLGLPPEDVFAFYSAAAAIDLVRPELPSQPVPLPSSQAPTAPGLSPQGSSPQGSSPQAWPSREPPPHVSSSPLPALAPAPRRSLLRKVFDKLRTS